MMSINPALDVHHGGGNNGSPFVWKYCRLCALEVKQGVYIFGEEGKRLQIPEKIRKTVAILVLEEDTLPKKICTACCTSLEQYVQFKDSVQDAQDKLAAIAKSIEKSQEQQQSLHQLRNQNHSSFQQQSSILQSPKRPKVTPPTASVSVISHSSSGNIISHSHHAPTPVVQQAPSLVLVAGEIEAAEDPEIDCDYHEPLGSIDSFDDNEDRSNDSVSIGAPIFREEEVQVQIQVHSSPPSSSLSPKPSTSKQASVAENSSNSITEKEKYPTTSTKLEEDCANVYLVCGICSIKILDKNNLDNHHSKSHQDSEETEPIYGCSACPRITPNYDAIRQHIYRHRMAGTFKCADCDKSFPTKDQLHIHISSKHNPDGNKAFICQSCGNQYGSSVALLAHRRKKHYMEADKDNEAHESQTEQQPQATKSPVPESGPSLSKSPAATAEVNPNLTSKPVPATPTLGDASTSREKEEGYWKCRICEKIFQSKHGYDTHMATHKGRRFACNQCGVSYTQKPTLDHHIRVHHTNADRSFECPECHKRFKTFRQLGWHKRTHERPLTDIRCPQCEKKFLNMISLKTHLKLHKGNKKYPCSECPKSFYSRQKLDEHTNSHTGRRPVGCPAERCTKFFSCFSNYAKHFKKHHSDLVGPKGKMIPSPKTTEDNNNDPLNSGTSAGFTSSSNSFISTDPLQPLTIPTLNNSHHPLPPQEGFSTSIISSSSNSQGQADSNSHLQAQTQTNLLHTPSRSGILPPCASVTSQGGVVTVTIPSFSTTSSQTQTQNSAINSPFHNNSLSFPPPPPPTAFHPIVPTTATAATATQTLDNNVNVAHNNHPTSNHSVVSVNHHTSPNSAQAHSSTHTQTQNHQHQFHPPHPPQAQSVWQPVMLSNSKPYHHSSSSGSGNNNILLSSFEILDCPPLVPMPAHPSESHLQHPHQQNTSTPSSGPTLVPVSVVVAHNSTTSAHAALSSNHHPPTSSSGHAIPVSSSNCSVNVPHFIPSSHQHEPMELSYKLDSNNFQEMPMELTKVFQRDPLELCVRQEFAHGQPLMDLSSRVVNVVGAGNGGMSMSLNGASSNSASSSGGNSSTSQNQGSTFSGGSGTLSNSMAYHKSVTEVIERELTLNDFTGAFRQPIDLISRTDEHSHELCSEGNLVDLSLRSSFGQDQSASSFLRELIDLSSRSDSFHGETNISNKTQGQQIGPHQHHPSSSSHHHHPPLPPPTSSTHSHSMKPGGGGTHSHGHNSNNNSHHHHHHPHPAPPPPPHPSSHHHVQNQSHPSSHPNSTSATTVTLQNVIYSDLNFSNL